MSIEQRNIMSDLRMMPDAALKQYAEMHKKDPYIFPLAFQESQDRENIRNQRQAQMAGMEQPKTVDAALNAMGPRLPEEQGIGALPAKNLQRMADGGIVGYADKGAVEGDPKQAFAAQYGDLARQAGQELGVDPTLILSQWGLESRWGKSPVGQFNLGNIKGKGTSAYDSAEKSKSSYRDYATPEAFKNDYVAQMKRNWPEAVGTGADVGAFTAGLKSGQQGGYATDKGYGSKLAATLTSMIPIGSAQAEPTQASNVSQIPTGQVTQYAPPAFKDSSSFMGAAADYIGIPEEWQRNINNTLTAYSGLGTPVAAIRGLNAASKGLEPTAEMLAKAQQAAQVAGTTRLAPPVKAGIAGLDVAAQETQAAAEAARRLRLLEQDRKAATGAQQSVEAATKTANIARGVEDAAAAKNAATTLKAQRLTNTARGAVINQALDSAGGIADVAANQRTGVEGGDQYGDFRPADLTKDDKDGIINKVEDEVPAEQRKGFSGEDLLMLGLHMMAGKSQYALQNIGEAGIATLANRQAQMQVEAVRGKTAAETKEMGQRGKYYEAMATSLASGEKLDAAAKAKASDAAVKLMAIWSKSPENQFATDAQRAQMYNTYYTQALAGSTIPQEAAAPASTGWGKAVQH